MPERVYKRGMPFSDEMVRAAWKRAAGRCECKRENHGHDGRCRSSLLWTMRGAEEGAGFEARQLTSWGTDVLTNCAILCAGLSEAGAGPVTGYR